MTWSSPLRRFKGSKKEFRGLELALKNNLYCIHNILETVMIRDTLDMEKKYFPLANINFFCFIQSFLSSLKVPNFCWN